MKQGCREVTAGNTRLMQTLTLYAANDAKASYALDLGPEVVRLLDPAGNVVAMFGRAECSTKISLPSKSPRRETIGIETTANGFVQLRPTPGALQSLNQYLGREPSAGGGALEAPPPLPEKLAPARSYFRDLMVGLVILLIGIGLVIGGLLELGRGPLGWALLIVGVLLALIGAGWIFEANLARGRDRSV